MDPRHDADLILGHLEGDLSPADAAKVQVLREADPGFAALLDGMADDRDQLRNAPPAEAPVGLTDMALADLERSLLLNDAEDSVALLPPGRRIAFAPLLVYGGIAAVLAFTASAVLRSVQPPAPSPPIAAAPADEGFDIAAAPIEAQREIARRDHAAADRELDATDAVALDDGDPLRAESTLVDPDGLDLEEASQQAEASAPAFVADAPLPPTDAAPAPAADLVRELPARRRASALTANESRDLAEFADEIQGARFAGTDDEPSSPAALAKSSTASENDAPVLAAAAPAPASPASSPGGRGRGPDRGPGRDGDPTVLAAPGRNPRQRLDAMDHPRRVRRRSRPAHRPVATLTGDGTSRRGARRT